MTALDNAPEQTSITLKMLQDRGRTLALGEGVPALRRVIEQFGAKKLTDIPETMYPEVAAALDTALRPRVAGGDKGPRAAGKPAEYARALYDWGLHVHPLSEGTKAPIGKAWPRRSREDSLALFGTHPTAGVGFIPGLTVDASTGELVRLVHVDIDGPDAWNWFQEQVPVEVRNSTVAWRTPRGGYGFIFRLPADSPLAAVPTRHVWRQGHSANAERKQEGVELRVLGNSVLPPTHVVIDGKPRTYSWLPGAKRFEDFTGPRELPSLPEALSNATEVNGGRIPDGEAAWLADPAPDPKKLTAILEVLPAPAENTRGEAVAFAYALHGALAGTDSALEADVREAFLRWAARWPGADASHDQHIWETTSGSVRRGWSHFLADARLFVKRARAASMAKEGGIVDGADPDAALALVEAAQLQQVQEAFAPWTEPLPGPDLAAAGNRSLYQSLRALRERLNTIPDPLERDTIRDEQLALLSKASRVPFATLKERLASFDAPHRQFEVQVIRPGPQLRDALSETPPVSLVPGYIFERMQHVIYGAPQAFKTFISLDWALHVAAGLPWLGVLPVRQCGVVYFAGESAASLRVRIAAWCAAHGLSVEQAEKLPFAVVPMVPTLGRGDDGLQDAIRRARAAAEGFSVPLGLVVIDNMTRLAAAAGLSTTDPGEYGRILGAIDMLGRALEVATLTIYHSPVSDPSRPAGTYQSTANPDVVIKAERDGGETRTRLRVAPPHGKSRNAVPPPDLVLELKRQDVRPWLTESYAKAGLPVPPPLTDAVGEAFDSADAHPLGAAFQEARRQHFGSLVIARGALAVTGTGEHGGRSQVRERVLQVLFARPGLCKGDLRRAVRGVRGTDVDASVQELIDDGYVDDVRKGNAHAYSLTAEGQQVATAFPEAGGDSGANS
jgi:hypothetical protein